MVTSIDACLLEYGMRRRLRTSDTIANHLCLAHVKDITCSIEQVLIDLVGP